ncbi:MAG: tRNA (adenosine(37)-N6)-threonylcarbamoyltransferase complex transferase subunit TsaD [Pseudomonadota bacterium]
MSSKCYVLGIETSCDETAASVVDADGRVLSSIVFSQIDMHNIYGGIVPELASRDHALKIKHVVEQALSASKLSADDITHVGVTSGPGLLGCLLVGLSFAKAFAMSKNIPLIEVDHVRAHVMSAFINGVSGTPRFPFAGLVVSGGHTSIYLVKSVNDIVAVSSTVDDAAGEVFDKLARFIGLGYPGGKAVSELARKGNAAAFASATAVKFPKPVIKGREGDFSFSGLKTSAINYFRNAAAARNSTGVTAHNGAHISVDVKKEDALAAFQETICEVLVEKLIAAAVDNNVSDVVIGGGVASNYRLRELFVQKAKQNSLNPCLIPIEYCTDNAAMIANYARLLIGDKKGFNSEMSKIKAYSTTRR